MAKLFYIQVALISKDPHLAYKYARVLAASNGFMLIRHVENVSDSLLRDKALKNVNAFVFDVQTIHLSELIKLRTIFASTKILAVDAGPEAILKVLSVGVDGYLSRSDNYKELLDFLWRITKGEKALDQNSLKYLFNIFRKELRSDLTFREMEVLEELSLGKSYRQIADKLFIGKATVKTHLEHIYDKLNARDKFEAIQKARIRKLI